MVIRCRVPRTRSGFVGGVAAGLVVTGCHSIANIDDVIDARPGSAGNVSVGGTGGGSPPSRGSGGGLSMASEGGAGGGAPGAPGAPVGGGGDGGVVGTAAPVCILDESSLDECQLE